MATVQSAYFTGNARTTLPQPHRKGETLTVLFTHTFNTAVTTADVLELVEIPPYAQIVGFEYASANIGAINVDIGIMSGTPGSTDASRTVGDEIVSAASIGTAAVVGVATLGAIAVNGESKVSIGLQPASNITAAANKTVTIKLTIRS